LLRLAEASAYRPLWSADVLAEPRRNLIGRGIPAGAVARSAGTVSLARHRVPGGMVTEPWDVTGVGVLRLPSGRLIRGRGLRRPLPAGQLPMFGVYLLGKSPPTMAWESRWLRWRDFWLPSDPAQARVVLHEAWERSAGQRVEIACGGGRGRTGTALACLAIIDGVPGQQAVNFVRHNYDEHAVETPWQRRYVTRFATRRPSAR
jgi:hypothetical protein